MKRRKIQRLPLALLSVAAISLTACSHYCPPYPEASKEAKQEMRAGFLDEDGEFKSEWKHTEEWLGRVQKLKDQLK